MPGGFNSHVMMCWPSNRDEIKRLSALTDGPPFVPTVEHSLSTCDSCERSIWIGPQQLQMARSPFLNAKKLCMFCVSTVQRTLKLRTQEVEIGMTLRNAVRRSA